jgi:hypothetical protein
MSLGTVGSNGLFERVLPRLLLHIHKRRCGQSWKLHPLG